MTEQLSVPAMMKEMPALASLLYELDLMPEQWDGEQDEWRANCIAIHMRSAVLRALEQAGVPAIGPPSERYS